METPEDLVWLRRLLDDSYARAGAYLRSVIGPERRLGAEDVVGEMGAMRTMALATSTAAGAPRVAPVDGLFHRGRLYFGSVPESLRFRHLRRRDAVSASVIEGERLQITVHGTAREVNPGEDTGLRDFLVSVYGQEKWVRWMRDLPWFRIEPERMISFRDSSPDAAS